ncbi:MAG: TetR/AcrR family transcriptional regulator [Pseudomonadota bacterium]
MRKINKVSAKRQESERQERRDRILTAAKIVFFKKGYIRTTMRDIALGAELSPGLLYHYFDNKDDIYGQICEEGFHIMIDTMAKADTNGKTTQAKLEILALAYVSFYMNYPEYFEIIFFTEFGYKRVGLNDRVEERLNRMSLQAFLMLNDVVLEAMSDGTIQHHENSWEITLSLWASVEGVIFIHKRGYLETYNLEIGQLLDRQIAILADGIRQG